MSYKVRRIVTIAALVGIAALILLGNIHK